MNIVKTLFVFSLGAFVGAHKYHLEYYWPRELNPRIKSLPTYTHTTEGRYEADVIIAMNDAYYRELREKMNKF